MHATLPAAAVLLAASLGTGFAQSPPDCANATSNVEMTDCAWKAYKAADKELNVVWKHVMATIKPEDYLPADAAKTWKDDLLSSQRAWITFKEKDCDAVAYEWYGGTGANLAVGSCLYNHTVQRTNDLKARYLNR
ncbi:MAG: DUF1311 domain-containing protein [Hyphomicrobiales bacterium]|nr:DUF1311 domain-containing protein [Hyphomicrobiales bacterium]